MFATCLIVSLHERADHFRKFDATTQARWIVLVWPPPVILPAWPGPPAVTSRTSNPCRATPLGCLAVLDPASVKRMGGSCSMVAVRPSMKASHARAQCADPTQLRRSPCRKLAHHLAERGCTTARLRLDQQTLAELAPPPCARRVPKTEHAISRRRREARPLAHHVVIADRFIRRQRNEGGNHTPGPAGLVAQPPTTTLMRHEQS